MDGTWRRVGIKSLEDVWKRPRERPPCCAGKAKDAGNTSAELKLADDLMGRAGGQGTENLGGRQIAESLDPGTMKPGGSIRP